MMKMKKRKTKEGEEEEEEEEEGYRSASDRSCKSMCVRACVCVRRPTTQAPAAPFSTLNWLIIGPHRGP